MTNELQSTATSVEVSSAVAASANYRGEFESAAASRGRPVLVADAISKEYRLGRGPSAGTISAVRDASFSLYERAVVALVGESGSGKSTIAKLLAGQEQLTSGQIKLNGELVHVTSSRRFRAYKREVQMVFQDPFASLNGLHTVRYHLSRPVRLHRKPRGKAAFESELSSLLEQVRLLPADQYLPKFPHELSGGQRQRVAIARALGAHPKVLLADEPVSMLDVSIRLEVLSLLDDIRERFSLAMLYVTHDIASARYFADETMVMYAGDIVERGPSEDVTQTPAHPYTQLLVSAAPDPDALGSTLRMSDKSGVVQVPRRSTSALLSVKGCRFAPRCRFADDHCRAEAPPLLPIAPQRSAACWHVDLALANPPGSLALGGEGEMTA